MGSPGAIDNKGPIIFFDGVCNLCNGAVQFILTRDHKNVFRFASLQSAFARDLLNQHQVDKTLYSIILVEEGQIYDRSEAVLGIARHLSAPWKFAYAFRFLPQAFLNVVYDFISSNRYRWFGKQNECWLPTPDLRQRFLA